MKTSGDALDRLREFVRLCPERPGVYLVFGGAGEAVYIGKARSLRDRLRSHFGPIRHPEPKEELIRRSARRIEIIETGSEAEALLLEAGLIKQHQPRYNQELKDDKSYPYLKITGEEFPRLLIVRGRKSDGSRYFGPYTSAKLLRQSTALLKRLFPLRTCQPMPQKVCLAYHIGQCPGPCEGHVSREEYLKIAEDLADFLEGKKEALRRSLEQRMREAAKGREYEKAKIYRDQIEGLLSLASGIAAKPASSVLDRMQVELGLSRFPARIEGFDISNFAGAHPVGSLVVFEGGKPKRSDYRRFKIRSVEGIDDYRMMRELVRRRFERLLAEKKRLPDLILIDGGKGHLAAVAEELDALNLSDRDILSIAKQHEHLFKPGRFEPYVLPQNSQILQLLRHLRDEAHRFAITFYRRLHRKSMQESILDGIPGLGPVKKARLFKVFGTLDRIQSADLEALRQKARLDTATAARIVKKLTNLTPSPS